MDIIDDKLTILVVDDVPENLTLLNDLLGEAGYTVLVALSGESAFQIISLNKPDIILLDALMPGIDGFEVAQRLKADFATCNIPIIFMTGLAETEDIVAAFSSGAVDYVVKPIKPKEVLARIESHLQNARQVQQSREILDMVDQAAIMVNMTDFTISWSTPLGITLLKQNALLDEKGGLDKDICSWLSRMVKEYDSGRDFSKIVECDGAKLFGRLLLSSHPGEFIVSLREENPAELIETLQQVFLLTMKEAEVLCWIINGKTNREIGMILGSSHRTIDKHIEHIYEKLGVETRVSAISVIMKKVQITSYR